MGGHLTWPPRGQLGHGYDPMFVPDGGGRTFAELDPAEKNRISHRARALEALSVELLSEAFGVYVHWPFCKAKCPYCDFNSHVRHGAVDAMSFARSLAAELAWFAERTRGARGHQHLLGGGTPSLMPPAAVGHVLDAIGRLWSVAPDVETTLEANPTSIEADNFRGYRAAGSTGSRSACSPWMMPTSRPWATAHGRGSAAAFRLAARISRARHSI